VVSDKPPIFAAGFPASTARRCLLLLAFFLLAACQTGPPVQEMNDARMAISAARDAGAEQLATAELHKAEEYLDRAEQLLTEKEYSLARRDAQSAKKSALSALSKAEDSDSGDSGDSGDSD
jgi:hypothetical protein